MANSKQISITRTEGEWQIIKNKLYPYDEKGLPKLSMHIRKEVLKVKNKLKEVPESVVCLGGEKVEKRPYLPTHIIEDIKLIALQMKVSESTVIDRLIITPLLQ